MQDRAAGRVGTQEVHACVEAGTLQARSMRSSEVLTLCLSKQQLSGADREAPGQHGRCLADMGNRQK